MTDIVVGSRVQHRQNARIKGSVLDMYDGRLVIELSSNGSEQDYLATDFLHEDDVPKPAPTKMTGGFPVFDENHKCERFGDIWLNLKTETVDLRPAIERWYNIIPFRQMDFDLTSNEIKINFIQVLLGMDYKTMLDYIDRDKASFQMIALLRLAKSIESNLVGPEKVD
jgi:hypothetical protein